jgi:hypothetical protein
MAYWDWWPTRALVFGRIGIGSDIGDTRRKRFETPMSLSIARGTLHEHTVRDKAMSKQ